MNKNSPPSISKRGNSATIVIGGDLCPIGANKPFFEQGDASALFNDLLPEFEQADLSVITLECPLVDANTPIAKQGPVLGAPSKCINGLKAAGIDILNLANNHIMDHGASGLENTLAICAESGVSVVGAAENLPRARQILIRNVNGIRIGILAMAEHEFSIASDHQSGANPLDLIDYVRNVGDQKEHVDFLIVLLHGGNEHYPLPSPRLQDTCRFLIEMGADAVVVQHTHCPGCYEQYDEGHIIYGQGNLIFDWPNQATAFHEGFLVRLAVGEHVKSALDIVPYVQGNGRIGARKMSPDEERSFRHALMERSEAVKDKTYVNEQWIRLCEQRQHNYLSKLLGHSRLFTKLSAKIQPLRRFYQPRSLVGFQNLISCEAHREVLSTIFTRKMLRS